LVEKARPNVLAGQDGDGLGAGSAAGVEAVTEGRLATGVAALTELN
jgi:hypothetical protein